jgi:hypothetical protein
VQAQEGAGRAGGGDGKIERVHGVGELASKQNGRRK